jgi:hypothetical protein
MTNLNDFVFPQLHASPESALHFSTSGYENLPDFMSSSSIPAISYLRQQTFNSLSNHK